MAQKVKDLYQILGVEKTATKKEIKKAYRRLSKELHPDVNSAENAKERFDEVKNAYEVLSNDEDRAKYDEIKEGGFDGGKTYDFSDVYDMFFSRERDKGRPIHGSDIHRRVLFTVPQVINRSKKQFHIKKNKECFTCDGDGYKKDGKKTCRTCSGKGLSKKEINTPFGVIQEIETCETCHGKGVEQLKECDTCEGSGTVPEDVSYTYYMRVDTIEGKQDVLKGDGNQGKHGGKPGNLILEMKHDPTDHFKIERDVDVISKISLSFTEALRGGEWEVIFPDGRHEKVSFPAGVQNGQRLAHPGEGLYGKASHRGIFYVEFHVQMPSGLTKEQIAAIEQAINK